jgi:transmembrane sensor
VTHDPISPHDADSRSADRIELLLDRYLAREATPSEAAELRTLTCGDRDATRRLDALGAYWDPASFMGPAQVAEAREALVQRLARIPVGEGKRRANRGLSAVAMSDVDSSRMPRSGISFLARPAGARHGWVRIFGGVSAVGAALALVLGTQRSSLEPSEPAPVQYVTHQGERADVTLSDGSRVILAPESRLHYATTPRGARIVTLSGQAHFTVTHDARHPFVVRAGPVETHVLGTAFDVRHYAGDSAVQIVVVNGKVAARGRRGRGAPVLLSAETEGRFTDSTALIVTNRKTDDAEAWTQGHLMFEDAPVSDVLRALQRWYGYEFRLMDSTMARQEVTARFTISDTVNTMAELKELLNVTLRFNGSVVTLTPVRGLKKTGPARHRWPNALPFPMEVGK